MFFESLKGCKHFSGRVLLYLHTVVILCSLHVEGFIARGVVTAWTNDKQIFDALSLLIRLLFLLYSLWLGSEGSSCVNFGKSRFGKSGVGAS